MLDGGMDDGDEMGQGDEGYNRLGSVRDRE